MTLYADAPSTAGRPAMDVPAATALRQLDRIIWFSIAAVTGIVVLAPLTGRFSIAWTTYAVPAAACIAMLLVAWFYRHYRPEERIASALEGTAQLAAFAAVGAPLSYLAASFGLPLQDRLFDAADHALGVDWLGLLHWMNQNPALHSVFSLTYLSFPVQASITVLALALTGRLVHLRLFMLVFIATAIVTILVSAVLPAQGVWGYYALTGAEYPAIIPVTREIHLPIFLGLRDGSFRTLMGTGSEGIITFPSLHAALGLIFILALWPVPVLRWIGLTVNILMIAATPVDGGHYVSDVLAGLLIAALCWLLGRRIAANAVRQARDGDMIGAPHRAIR
jgi:membrane-associated phospholipid phosphatase